ncbi:hypothetical protein F5I97DRAFT_1862670 [Phlebopus sp. FC_14]|nr:hypothetical protein F5I97DRAFT_1862670 [Phlebopus sp. FC_14]
MHLDLLPRQCVSCPTQPPVCTCSAGQSCVQISQSCNACPTFTCQASPSANTGDSASGGVSSGALAGAIVAVLLVLIGALLLFFLYRRRQRRRARTATIERKPDVPAPAEAVLNRPDPTEKNQTPAMQASSVRVYSSSADSVIDLDPQSGSSSAITAGRTSGRPSTGNPFDDNQSIQTTSTGTNGTNVIPIALVSPGSVQSSSSRSESGVVLPSSPARPVRPMDLNLDHSQVSTDSLREPSPRYAQSQRSGSSRMSYMSNTSYTSDFLNEAPMIVTQNQGAVRQVVGKVKAEVIQTSGATTPTTPTSHVSADGLKLPSISRPSVRSPLAASSFGPADVVDEGDEEHELSMRGDPFGDDQAPPTKQSRISNVSQAASDFTPEAPTLPWTSHDNSSRPDSLSTQAASVIDISSATRVNVSLLPGRSDQKSPQHTTMAKAVSPASVLSPSDRSTLQEQQQLALAHAQAQARAQGFDRGRRMSGTSVVSTTSTRADSILESFPFVPPSPISSRPVRSPPRSPLHQQFSTAQPVPPVPPIPSVVTAPTSAPSEATSVIAERESVLRPPPSRRILGMSTGSQLSTASSGLGNFPFHIDNGGAESTQPPSIMRGRQRASLDTLVLMSDLSSYPLGYDRDEHDSLPRTS